MPRSTPQLLKSAGSERPTRSVLVAAAAEQFNTLGYFGTDTNKIARAAGYAPQTFYRHFSNKTDIFIAVYEAWQSSEREMLTKAARARDPDREIASALLDHHRRWRGFRRSLRMLAVDDDQVRRARAFSRERQLADMLRIPANSGRPRAAVLADLLRVERFCDAAADGELSDLGVTDAETTDLVLTAVMASRGTGRTEA